MGPACLLLGKAMSMTTTDNREKLAADLKRIVHDSEELLLDSANSVGEKAHAARERLGQMVESARATYHRLEQKTKEAAKATDQQIRHHPYQSIGIAFGVGLLIGILATRTR